MASLGETIRQHRLSSGLTLREMARRVGISAPYLTDIEADRRHPAADVLTRIADVLEVDAAGLEAVSGRLRPEMRRWVEAQPEVGRLLRRLRAAPNQGELLRRFEEALDAERSDAP